MKHRKKLFGFFESAEGKAVLEKNPGLFDGLKQEFSDLDSDSAALRTLKKDHETLTLEHKNLKNEKSSLENNSSKQKTELEKMVETMSTQIKTITDERDTERADNLKAKKRENNQKVKDFVVGKVGNHMKSTLLNSLLENHTNSGEMSMSDDGKPQWKKDGITYTGDEITEKMRTVYKDEWDSKPGTDTKPAGKKGMKTVEVGDKSSSELFGQFISEQLPADTE